MDYNYEPASLLETALCHRARGTSVLPIRGDGTKRPACDSWAEYQSRLPSEDELTRWFANKDNVGLGIIAGRGLEVLDFDVAGLFEQFHEHVEETAPGLVGCLPRVLTPSGGTHLYYRCDVVGRNDKLARDQSGKTLIETRGEGGYVVAPPSPPFCHPANKPYLQVAGPPLPEIPLIAPEQREVLHGAARSLNRKATRIVSGPQRQRPGDALSAAATWPEVLEPAGWTLARKNGNVLYWRKPGATGLGHHATTGHCDDYFYCFSTNAGPFEAETAYTKFTAYALLNHGGDFAQAAKDLQEKGYGEPFPGAPPTGADIATNTPNEAPDDPHRLARQYLERDCFHADGPTLRFYQGEWHLWDGASYGILPAADLRARVSLAVKAAFDEANLADMKEYERRAKERLLRRGEDPPTVRKVTQGVVNNVMQALAGLVVLPPATREPGWIGETPFPADEVLAARNGLVHLPSFLAGQDYWREPTPRFFSPNALDYDFTANAGNPNEWLAFLEMLWPDDAQSVGTLQEWFGYCLLPDTKQQKMLLLVGPKRSGKGTIARILTALVGRENVAGPTLSSLAMCFGLWPLLGKTLAVVSDARLSGRADATVITERLLSISGEDTLTIDRKHLQPVNVKLAARLTILTNELPKVNDASGALVGRMLLLRLTKSWYGREDAALFDRLAREMPGILLWAIEGWRRLRERRHFVQPGSGRELLGQLEDLGSPISEFIRDCSVVGACQKVSKADLYQHWTRWCSAAGRDQPGDAATFGRNLLAAEPTVRVGQQRVGEKRVGVYLGIGLAAGGRCGSAENLLLLN